MVGLSLSFAYFVGTLGVYGSTMVFRMSETQFNEVAKDAFHFRSTDQTNEFSNSLDSPDHLAVHIQSDGTLRTTAIYDRFTASGGINLKLQEMTFFDYSVQLQFESCTLVSEGKVDSIVTIDHETTKTVRFQTDGCVFTCTNVSIPQEFGDILKQYINTTQIIHNLQIQVCRNYKVTFDLVLTSHTFTVPMLSMTSNLLDTQIRIINSTIVLMQEVTFSQIPLPKSEPEIGIHRDLPEVGAPFEIYMSRDMLDEAFNTGREELFSGNETVKLSSFLPLFSQKQMQSLGNYIPKLGRTFPNSTFDMVLTNMTANSIISNNSVWIHGTLDGKLLATLACNTNRTYTAFDFRIIISAPIQLASDNKHIGMRLTTFRGNFTILDTNIGRIADRFLESVFFVLPQLNLLSDVQSESLNGLNLSTALPYGFGIRNTSIKLVKDYIVIGGHLTKDDSQQDTIPYENLTWIGDLGDTDNYFFPLIDNTPENATGLPIQNCTGSPQIQTISASSSMYHTPLIFFLWFFGCLAGNLFIGLLFV